MTKEYCGEIGFKSPCTEKSKSLLERLEERRESLGREIITVEETIVLLKNNPEFEGFTKKVKQVILY